MNTEVVSYDSNELLIAVSGRIDAGNAPEFSAQIQAIRDDKPEGKVILDLEKLDYISSAGLRVIVALVKSEKPNVPKLIHVSEEIMEVLEDTGILGILDAEN